MGNNLNPVCACLFSRYICHLQLCQKQVQNKGKLKSASENRPNLYTCTLTMTLINERLYSVLLCMKLKNADIVPSTLCIPVWDSRLFIPRQYCFTVCMDREPHGRMYWWIHKWMDKLTDWLINILKDIPMYDCKIN